MVLEILQFLSILIEAVVAILGLMIFIKGKKNYGWGIFLTFAIYVFYDLAKQASWIINNDILYGIFFIASISALCAVYMIYKEIKK